MLLGFFANLIRVTLPSTYTAQAGSTSPSNARADFALLSDGTYGRYINNAGTSRGSYTEGGDWVDNIPALIDPTLFEYNITLSSGTSPAGDAIHANTTTWTDMPASGEVFWYLLATGASDTTCDLDLQIQEKLNHDNIDTSVITISAQYII